MRLFAGALMSALLAATLCAPASAKPPLEAFGDQPSVRFPELSPDGEKVAFVARVGGKDMLALYNLRTREQKALIPVGDIRANGILWVGDRFIVLRASRTERAFGFADRFQASSAFAYDLKTDKMAQLLRRTDGLFAAQEGLGKIIGVDPDGKHVFMPAFMDGAPEPTLDVLRVDLETGKGSRVGGRKGNTETIDWLVNDKGEVVAREDFYEKRGLHEIFAIDGDKTTRIYSEQVELPAVSLSAVSRSNGALIVVTEGESEFVTAHEISRTDGKLSAPLSTRANADIDALLTDINRSLHGFIYSGTQPTYQMFDTAFDEDLKILIESLPDTSVWVDSWSADKNLVLVLIEGGALPQRYAVFNRREKRLTNIVNLRPEIGPGDVGEVIAVNYQARDGLEIPSILTWPAGVPEDKRQNLPLVVLPHGGPESYDGVGFDWLAQFIANEGYMVLQPNFRGSSGFGSSFLEAGRQQWGRKMQDDITDGVKALESSGLIDPKRVCIVGWSYGGYAALAGGSLTPDLYSCVASIAGVSDLPAMLLKERKDHGEKSAAYRYWRTVIGDPYDDRAELEKVSPARLASAVKAPVLLIHGTDDLIVPSSQSATMHSALKAAGKKVSYVEIKGDDHSLVSNESRRTALTALGEFLAQHLKAQ